MEGILFWIWLSLRCTPGSGSFDLLNRAFSSPYDVYDADEAQLCAALARYDADLKRLCDKSTADAERVLHYCTMAGVTLIAYDDPRYPAALREIAAPPVLLYCRGALPQFAGRLTVAVVGTRKMSEYGKRMAFEISRDLARAGVIVVSGMALGIDGVANAAAVNGGGETVAVLGSGIDIIYPSAHRTLADAVARHGAIITEYAPGTRPEGRNFPVRNRLISGLAQASAVIEADLRSGALITARRARQQNRVLYALPGRVDEPGSEGPCMLLREGAKLLTCADDILTDFEKVYADKINIFKLLQRVPAVMDAVLRSMRVSGSLQRDKVPPALRPEKPTPPPAETAPPPSVEKEAHIRETLASMNPVATQIYNLLPPAGVLNYDAIVDAGISITDVMSLTTDMEMRGLLTVLPGGYIGRAASE